MEGLFCIRVSDLTFFIEVWSCSSLLDELNNLMTYMDADIVCVNFFLLPPGVQEQRCVRELLRKGDHIVHLLLQRA